MNETLKTIQNRYSCRNFTGEAISKEDMEAIALAASSLGLGNVICGLARMVFDVEKAAEYKAKLIQEGYEFGMSVLVGKAVDPDGTPHEPDMDKIVYIG